MLKKLPMRTRLQGIVSACVALADAVNDLAHEAEIEEDAKANLAVFLAKQRRHQCYRGDDALDAKDGPLVVLVPQAGMDPAWVVHHQGTSIRVRFCPFCGLKLRGVDTDSPAGPSGSEP